MNAVLFALGFSLCCGAAYVGVRLIMAARADAVQQQIADEYTALERADARRALKEQNVRAIASDSIVQAIAEYEAHDLRAQLHAVQAITTRGTR